MPSSVVLQLIFYACRSWKIYFLRKLLLKLSITWPFPKKCTLLISSFIEQLRGKAITACGTLLGCYWHLPRFLSILDWVFLLTYFLFKLGAWERRWWLPGTVCCYYFIAVGNGIWGSHDWNSFSLVCAENASCFSQMLSSAHPPCYT